VKKTAACCILNFILSIESPQFTHNNTTGAITLKRQYLIPLIVTITILIKISYVIYNIDGVVVVSVVIAVAAD